MAFVLAAAAAIALMPALAGAGTAVGLVDRPGGPLRIHSRPVPLLGGVGVAAATLGAVAVVQRGISVAVAAAVGVAMVTGLLDDARTLPPWGRVALVAGAGVVLAVGLPGLPPVAVVGVVALVVACANAVNLVDGQDGLAGGLTVLAAVGMAVVSGWGRSPEGVTLALALAGAAAGFLLWNRPPARIFLGNGGAYAVGTMLATLTVAVTAAVGWRGLLAAGACLGVFAFELVFTVARRFRARTPITAGDRLHSYDVVTVVVGGRTRSTAVFWGLGVVAAGVGIVLGAAPPAAAVAVAAVGLAGSVGLGVVLWSRVR